MPPLDVTDYVPDAPAFPRPRSHYNVILEDTQGLTGFSFENRGINRIIPSAYVIGAGPAREYGFIFPGRARKDIHLTITDLASEQFNNRMNTVFVFLPRKVLPAIKLSDDESVLTVTLPTEETVRFNAVSKEIIDGVLTEGNPIDLSPNEKTRKAADVTYNGSFVLIRGSRRGMSPIFGTVMTVQKGSKKCSIPSKDLWKQEEHSGHGFSFATDEEADVYLKKKCGFGVF